MIELIVAATIALASYWIYLFGSRELARHRERRVKVYAFARRSRR